MPFLCILFFNQSFHDPWYYLFSFSWVSYPSIASLCMCKHCYCRHAASCSERLNGVYGIETSASLLFLILYLINICTYRVVKWSMFTNMAVQYSPHWLVKGSPWNRIQQTQGAHAGRMKPEEWIPETEEWILSHKNELLKNRSCLCTNTTTGYYEVI